MKEEDVLVVLAEHISRYDSRNAFGRAHNINPKYVAQVQWGTRPASDRLLAILGLERTETRNILPTEERDMRLGYTGQLLLEHKIDDAVSRHGSKKAWARHLGVSETYISTVARGMKPPSKRVLEDLGLVMVHETTIREKRK